MSIKVNSVIIIHSDGFSNVEVYLTTVFVIVLTEVNTDYVY